MSNHRRIILSTDELSADILAPQDVSVQFPREVRVSPIYIGVIAYSEFEKVEELDRAFGLQYNYKPLTNDLLPGRLLYLRRLFDYLYISSNRPTTKFMKVSDALYFTEWFMNHGNSLFLESVEQAIISYVDWTKEIERQIKSGESSWGRRTAQTYQSSLLQLFQTRFGDAIRNTLQQSIYSLTEVRTIKEVRSKDDAGNVLKSLIDIATGLSELVTSESNFPYRMQYQGKAYFIFPNDKGYVKTKHTVFTINSYNYKEGSVITPEEVIATPMKERKVQLWTVKDAVVNLEKNNKNKVSQTRLRFADLACCCFLEIFLILTGMSRSEVVQIENVESLTSKKSEYSNEFRAIKFRAKHKITTYRLHRQGLQVLEKYLSLRKWLLNAVSGSELNKLFIRVITPSGIDAITPPFIREVKADDIGRVYKRLEGKFFPVGMKTLTPQETRRLKNVVLHENNIPHKAIADTLNHSESVNQRVYSNTVTSSQKDEMILFWRSVQEAAKQIKVIQIDDIEEPRDGEISISLGHCAEYKKPVELEPNPIVQPNCITQYGCLYCNKYCCHADEEDIHKLLSLSFVISCLKSRSLYLESHNDAISKIHIRVNVVLDQVKSTSEYAHDVYERVYEKVWELGELTPFWELRLRRYESMGVVF